MNLYSAVKVFCVREKLSISDLAKKIGVNRKTLYSAMKTGNPRLSTIQAVASALNINVSELIREAEKMSVPINHVSAVASKNKEETKTMKPVWRENTGRKPPQDNLDFVLLRNGNLTNRQQTFDMADFDWFIQGLLDDITAYQTTRTREAKYERVECDKCYTTGDYESSDGRKSYRCPSCKGKGYTREAKKMIAISVSTSRDRLKIVTASHGVIIAHFDEVSEIKEDGRFMIVRLTDGKASVIKLTPIFKHLLSAQISLAANDHGSYMMARLMLGSSKRALIGAMK